MDENFGTDPYNVVDLTEEVISYSDSDDTSVSSELFQKVIEFDEVFARQIEDFTTPPKRKPEEDVTSSSKCPRLSESPGTP